MVWAVFIGTAAGPVNEHSEPLDVRPVALGRTLSFCRSAFVSCCDALPASAAGQTRKCSRRVNVFRVAPRQRTFDGARSLISPRRPKAKPRRLTRRACNLHPCHGGSIAGVVCHRGLLGSGTANRSPRRVDRIAHRHLPCAKRASLLSYRTPTLRQHTHDAMRLNNNARGFTENFEVGWAAFASKIIETRRGSIVNGVLASPAS
jgi:hypothetical protein